VNFQLGKKRLMKKLQADYYRTPSGCFSTDHVPRITASRGSRSKPRETWYYGKNAAQKN